VTMVGLTNDERCLINNLRMEKYRSSERITKTNELYKRKVPRHNL